MYYKIITERSFFTDLYENIDVFNIPYGTVFSAPESSKHRPNDPKCMVKESVFHFAEGAFDTMLWHTRLIHHVLPSQIYAVQPLTKVIAQKCADSLGLYQCGANKIKILGKQNIDNMYDMAVEEYKENINKYTNFKISINAWKKHEPTCFYVHQYYR